MKNDGSIYGEALLKSGLHLERLTPKQNSPRSKWLALAASRPESRDSARQRRTESKTWPRAEELPTLGTERAESQAPFRFANRFDPHLYGDQPGLPKPPLISPPSLSPSPRRYR